MYVDIDNDDYNKKDRLGVIMVRKKARVRVWKLKKKKQKKHHIKF